MMRDLLATSMLSRNSELTTSEASTTEMSNWVLRDYADDLVYLSPGMEPVLGKDALRALVTPLYEQMRFDIAMTPERVEVARDAAYEWGYSTGETAAGPEAAPVAMGLRYVLVYRRRVDGSWEINLRCDERGSDTDEPGLTRKILDTWISPRTG